MSSTSTCDCDNVSEYLRLTLKVVIDQKSLKSPGKNKKKSIVNRLFLYTPSKEKKKRKIGFLRESVAYPVLITAETPPPPTPRISTGGRA